jgi:hypothetical protein
MEKDENTHNIKRKEELLTDIDTDTVDITDFSYPSDEEDSFHDIEEETKKTKNELIQMVQNKLAKSISGHDLYSIIQEDNKLESPENNYQKFSPSKPLPPLPPNKKLNNEKKEFIEHFDKIEEGVEFEIKKLNFENEKKDSNDKLLENYVIKNLETGINQKLIIGEITNISKITNEENKEEILKKVIDLNEKKQIIQEKRYSILN